MSAERQIPKPKRDMLRSDITSAPDVRKRVNEYMVHHHCNESEAIRGLIRKEISLEEMEQEFQRIINEKQQEEANNFNEKFTDPTVKCDDRIWLKGDWKCINKKAPIDKTVIKNILTPQICEICLQHQREEAQKPKINPIQLEHLKIQKTELNLALAQSKQATAEMKLETERTKTFNKNIEQYRRTHGKKIRAQVACQKGFVFPSYSQCIHCGVRARCEHPYKIRSQNQTVTT